MASNNALKQQPSTDRARIITPGTEQESPPPLFSGGWEQNCLYQTGAEASKGGEDEGEGAGSCSRPAAPSNEEYFGDAHG